MLFFTVLARLQPNLGFTFINLLPLILYNYSQIASQTTENMQKKLLLNVKANWIVSQRNLQVRFHDR